MKILDSLFQFSKTKTKRGLSPIFLFLILFAASAFSPAMAEAYIPVVDTDGEMTVFFEAPSSSYSTVYVYIWDSSNTPLSGSWPGTEMTLAGTTLNGENNIWKYTYTGTGTPAYVIFNNNNNGTQTDNLIWSACGYYYSGQSGTEAIDVITTSGATIGYTPTLSSDEYTIFFENSSSFSNPYAYVWNSSENNTWPGVQMTYVGQTINGTRSVYKYTSTLSDVPTNVIFTDNGSSKTSDLTWTTGGYYTGSTLTATITPTETTSTLTITQPDNGTIKVYTDDALTTELTDGADLSSLGSLLLHVYLYPTSTAYRAVELNIDNDGTSTPTSCASAAGEACANNLYYYESGNLSISGTISDAITLSSSMSGEGTGTLTYTVDGVALSGTDLSAYVGQTLTAVATAADGSYVSSLTINGTEQDTYTIQETDVTVTVAAVFATCPTAGFTATATLNSDKGTPWAGSAGTSSGAADGAQTNAGTGGTMANDYRTITLTTDVVADSYAWALVSAENETTSGAASDVTISDASSASTTATISLPGMHVFSCTATCGNTTAVSYVAVDVPYPSIGFDGPIGTPSSVNSTGWDHTWASTDGLMTRSGLTWTTTFTYQYTNSSNEFVIIQQYKLGCTENEGWAGYAECSGSNDGNKINASTLTFSGLQWSENTQGYNFIPTSTSGWVANSTQITLSVTMLNYDEYSITLTANTDCPEAGFAISATYNPTNGVFADSDRSITLSTSAAASSYTWTCTSATHGTDKVTIDATTQTATATVSLPGEYTFTCTAVCDGNEIVSDVATVSVPYPEMGFDGPIGTPESESESGNPGWNHSWAGVEGGGLMTRDGLTWSVVFTYLDVASSGGSSDNHFVIIQRYKLGCTENEGWAGYQECTDLGNKGNKINSSTLTLTGLALTGGTAGDNFIASDYSSWTAGSTMLKLSVVMSDYDTYAVTLEEIIALKTSVNDDTMGGITVTDANGNIVANNTILTDYVGQDLTITLTPNSGYRATDITVNGTSVWSGSTTSAATYTHTVTDAGMVVVGTLAEGIKLSTTVNDETMGSIAVSSGGTTIASGDDVTSILENKTAVDIALAPTTGYYLQSLTINGTEVLSAIQTGEYTYTYTPTGEESAFEVVATYAANITLSLTVDGYTTVTVTAPDGSTTLANGDDITAYIGQTLSYEVVVGGTEGYSISSVTVNGTTVSGETTSTTYSGTHTLTTEGLSITAYAKVVCATIRTYTLSLSGEGIICSAGGAAYMQLYVSRGLTYQLYKDGEAYGTAQLCEQSETATFTVTEAGTYTAQAYEASKPTCEAVAMSGSPVITTVSAPTITMSPSTNSITIYQRRTFTSDYEVTWTDTATDAIVVTNDTKEYVAKYPTEGDYTITATLAAPNDACSSTMSHHISNPVTEQCAE